MKFVIFLGVYTKQNSDSFSESLISKSTWSVIKNIFSKKTVLSLKKYFLKSRSITFFVVFASI